MEPLVKGLSASCLTVLLVHIMILTSVPYGSSSGVDIIIQEDIRLRNVLHDISEAISLICSNHCNTESQVSIIVHQQLPYAIFQNLRNNLNVCFPWVIQYTTEYYKEPATSEIAEAIGKSGFFILFFESIELLGGMIAQIRQLSFWNARAKFLVLCTQGIVPTYVLNNIFHTFWRNKILNVELLLSLESCSSGRILKCLRLLSYTPFNAENNSKANSKIKLHMLERRGLDPNYLFQDKTSDVEGYPLYVVQYDAADEPSMYDSQDTIGFKSEILNILVEYMNFTPSLVLENNEYTKLNVVSAVITVHSFGDITSSAVPMLVDFHAIVEFSTALPNAIYFTFVSPKVKPIPQWMRFFLPFNSSMWGLLLAMFLFIVAADTFTLRILSRQKISYVSSLLNNLSVALNVSVPHQPSSVSLRTIFIINVITFLVISTIYQGSLLSCTIYPKFYPPIETREDVASSVLPVEIYYGFILMVRDSTDPTMKKIASRTKPVPSGADSIKLLAARQDRIVIDLLFTVELVSQYCRSTDNSLLYHVSADYIGYILASYPVPKNSPYLPRINMAIRRLIEGGLQEKWTNEYMEMYRSPETQSKSKRNVKLSVSHLQTPFYLLSIGYFTGVSSFLTELLYFHWKKLY